MIVVYSITPELRDKFKAPFGKLIQGSFNETMAKMKELLNEEKPGMIISVGDVVSHNLHEHDINPQLTIIDNKSLRAQTLLEKVKAEKTIYVKNPRGTITQEAILAIAEALERKKHIHIVVDGEEDLLTLVAVLHAPIDSFVVYGQPGLGIVVVRVTADKKVQVEDFLKAMKPLEKLNKKKTV